MKKCECFGEEGDMLLETGSYGVFSNDFVAVLISYDCFPVT